MPKVQKLTVMSVELISNHYAGGSADHKSHIAGTTLLVRMLFCVEPKNNVQRGSVKNSRHECHAGYCNDN